ncbi:hypothetical protein ABC345_21045 [Shouchella sp. 1P09AA]|uniref:hypothetical protein n=1 Tax=unclassified Shouchella TaxID=2893065 RepID=UPI0039A365E3
METKQDRWWRIADFTDEISEQMQIMFQDDTISMHTNTIDRWFKDLEKKGIHYINRSTSKQRVYDESDLKIGLFIAEYRYDEEKKNMFNLDAVYYMIQERDEFTLRPFPQDVETEGTELSRVPTFDDFKDMLEEYLPHLKEEIKQELRQEVKQEVTQGLQADIKRMLPEPKNPEALQREKLDDALTRTRIELQLRDDALTQWAAKPSEERMKKAGLFRKEEDVQKREDFIHAYKRKHYDDALKRSFGLD